MTRSILISAAVLAVLSLSGCSNGMDELHKEVEEIKSRPGDSIEALDSWEKLSTKTSLTRLDVRDEAMIASVVKYSA